MSASASSCSRKDRKHSVTSLLLQIGMSRMDQFWAIMSIPRLQDWWVALGLDGDLDRGIIVSEAPKAPVGGR
jgi:hypothetical protein